MSHSINPEVTENNLFAPLSDDTVENRARLQLLFIGSLFVTCATIGYLQMGELFTSTQSVPMLGALLGM